MANLAYRNVRDSVPDSGVRLKEDQSGIRRRPPARTFSTRLLESVKDTVSSVRSLVVSLKATRRDPNDVIESIERTPTPPEIVFAQYAPKTEGAAVFKLGKTGTE